MIKKIRILFAYWRTKRLFFTDRSALERYQTKKINLFIAKLQKQSRYFSQFGTVPWQQWPLMDKAVLLKNFDQMNTAGISFKQALHTALQAEHSRDFSPTRGKYTVGLSSGTSAQRGVFVVSENEQAQWAGVMLAKALPDGLLAKEKVALFLRANSNMYNSVGSRFLQFRFFDLFQKFDAQLPELAGFQPSILLAPAQVLRALALAQINGEIALTPKRVYSIAEVLESQDRLIIEQAFGQVHEIYQATEGFLASTCELGVLHLNEEYLHIEPEWLDKTQQRFVPIITDFSRTTQPIVRYRLNDILHARATPCTCGSATRAIDRIEGRCDDMLRLPKKLKNSANTINLEIDIFADVVSRALAQVLPWDADYQLRQISGTQLVLHLAYGRSKQDNFVFATHAQTVLNHLQNTLSNLDVNTNSLEWKIIEGLPERDLTRKLRRIVRESNPVGHGVYP